MLVLDRGGTRMPTLPVELYVTYKLAEADLFCTKTMIRFSVAEAGARISVTVALDTEMSECVMLRMNGEDVEI
jgi:hypothetical protein